MRTAYKDGWLTIREEMALSDEPKLQVTYWPIYQESERVLREGFDLLDKDATYNGSGSYSIRIAPYQYRSATLINGGQTRPIAMETLDIPAPKVRKGVQIRYRNSEWQKLLKTGWTRA